ncbi:MAG: DUF1549 domain-containing protein [Planctomycetes bacterium]|nr:DUF1549 domain-containing protein [Planctomycetota bacterium]
MKRTLLSATALLFASLPARSADLTAKIDESVAAVWKRENVAPAPPTDDSEFLRRVHLDLCGTIPSFAETTAFLNDTTPDKREKLVDRLLDDPRFAQHQADVWDQVLFGRNPPGYQTNVRGAFQEWLKNQFEQNTPYDQWVGAILRAEGNSVDDGPPMWFCQYSRKPEDATEAITQKFLGIQLQCARCHDHPFEEWTQLDFYGMAAFVARIEVVHVAKENKLTKFAIGEKSSGDVLFTGPASEQKAGQKGEPVKPRFLLGEKLAEPPLPEGFKEVKFASNKVPPAPKFSRKNQLAEWVTSPENPYFARAVVNRVWGQFLGRGLVHPVDNMSPANEPTHPELLDELTAKMIEHKFDLKWLIRELVLTKTYQLSSRGASGEALPQWFQHGRTRPLSAEELVESWRVATLYDQSAYAKGRVDREGKDRYRPFGSGYIVRFFGKPSDGTGNFQGGLHEQLYLSNGPLGSVIGSGKGSLVDSLVAEEMEAAAQVERIFLSVLSRKPSEEETARFAEFLAVTGTRPNDQLGEAMRILMPSSEFRLNH